MIGSVPKVGQTLLDGEVIVVAVGESKAGDITILGERVHPLHPYATWLYDPAHKALYTGHYFEDLGAAWDDLIAR